MSRPKHVTGRRGGVLVVVLTVVALMGLLVLSAAVHEQLRWSLVTHLLRRASARDAARSEIALILHELSVDTNAVDSLDEPWATNPDRPLSDEESRIDLRAASAGTLAALLSQAAGLPQRAAETLAQSIVAWRTAQPTPPAAVELFGSVPGMDPAVLARIAPHSTVHGHGRVNLNTADELVLRTLLAGLGIARDAQDRMLAALRTARRRGTVCEAADAPSLARVFIGERSIPGPVEAEVLRKLAPLLSVTSTAFRGVTTGTPTDAEDPKHAIALIYHRPSATFLRWVE